MSLIKGVWDLVAVVATIGVLLTRLVLHDELADQAGSVGGARKHLAPAAGEEGYEGIGDDLSFRYLELR